MAPNMDGFCRDLAGYISKKLSMPVDFIIDLPWQARERMLDEGSVDLCWICGLPYVRKAALSPGSMEPLVAPVMAGSRYGNVPVYFSDVVVHRDAPYFRLEDLEGATWAYNEPGSHSGYCVVCYELALKGKSLDFFGQVIESGSHQTSLALILKKEVDGSAIDSTVLELEIANHPEIASQIRIVGSFGPSPIPPWVVTRKVPAKVRGALREVLTGMRYDPAAREILMKARISHFDPVDDSDYEPIRVMERIAFRKG